jgi:N-acyl-phosphatidylethanolamine-hydrolysing phospholipase D
VEIAPDHPDHHRPAGGFRNPWIEERRPGAALLRWAWERSRKELPPSPGSEELPRSVPAIARPRAGAGEARATWVGHATFLLQLAGLNALTDPHWSERASPFGWAGPRRLAPPGVDREDLPPIDLVLVSHDHYDHLDRETVRGLAARFGDDVRWLAPLGHGSLLAGWGARRVVETDWWEGIRLETEGGEVEVTCLPAQHWTNRGFWDRRPRLWSSWALRQETGSSVYFGGDSGWFPGYTEIGRRLGAFDLVLLPIGAYDPRWMMRASHMNPEEAVRAYLDLGGSGTFGAMHWGTFRLTDEDPLEPPERLRTAWAAAGLPPDDLWIPAHGETRVWPAHSADHESFDRSASG